jgi:hypothetical protein
MQALFRSPSFKIAWWKRHLTKILLCFANVARIIENLELDTKGFHQFLAIQQNQNFLLKDRRKSVDRKDKRNEGQLPSNTTRINFSWGNIRKNSDTLKSALEESQTQVVLMEWSSETILKFVSP